LSHARERSEQDCLNCGTIVAGRFCQQCGQENIELKESVWDLVTHFFNDITHFHGKFFSTVWHLLTKPGFLSKEYVEGRRARYLHPIRLYVFTSAFFFIVFFTLFSSNNIGQSSRTRLEESDKRYEVAIRNLEQSALTHADPVVNQTATTVLAQLKKEQATIHIQLDSIQARDSARKANSKGKLTTEPAQGIEFSDEGIESFDVKNVGYKSVLAYQRMQQALPASHRDGWMRRQFTGKVMQAVETGNANEQQYLKTLVDYLLHSFPKMLFITLPFFALLLKMLYRRRKDLYFADHAIYAIHLFCATFLITLFFFFADKLNDNLNWSIFSFIQFALVVWAFIYQYKSMRYFYGQGRLKTILKFSLLNFLAFLVTSFLLVFFLALSAVQASNAH
jgi:hypothetical protein